MSALEVEVEGHDSRSDTLKHIREVQLQMRTAVLRLSARAMRHDESKLFEPELSGWNKLVADKERAPYGSAGYIDALDRVGVTCEMHYAANDHHPEHHGADGVAGMSALAIIEMVCDWKAASERGAQAMTFAESLIFNQERFGYGDELALVIERTAEELGYL